MARHVFNHEVPKITCDVRSFQICRDSCDNVVSACKVIMRIREIYSRTVARMIVYVCIYTYIHIYIYRNAILCFRVESRCASIKIISHFIKLLCTMYTCKIYDRNIYRHLYFFINGSKVRC